MSESTNPTLAALSGLKTLVRGRPHAEPRRQVGGVDLSAILQVLVAAVAEIDMPERWCKGSPAVLRSGAVVRDIDDLGIYPQNWLAQKCSEGAVHYATFWAGYPLKVALQAVHLLESYAHDSLYEVNDAPETTHADMVALFRRAISDLAREV